MICLIQGGIFHATRKIGRLCCTIRHILRQHKNIATRLLTRHVTSEGKVDSKSIRDMLVSLPGFVRRTLVRKRSIAVGKLNSFRITIADSKFRRPSSIVPNGMHLSHICFHPSGSLITELGDKVSFCHCPLDQCFPRSVLQPRALQGRQTRKGAKVPSRSPIKVRGSARSFSKRR